MRKLKKDKYIGEGAKRHDFKIFNAFTLAEMMVVMLIVSIVLAAMAPVMTTKNKVDNSSPWRYSPANSSDAYFGAGEAMRALIGQVNGEDTDLGKLIINNNATDNSHILFKSNNDVLGDLYFNGTSLILGERRSRSTEAIGNENINIGHENWPTTDITGSSNITIGDASMRSLTTGSHNIGLGTTLGAVSTGSNNIGIGDDSIENTNGDYNIAVGTHAYRRGTGGSNVIVGGDAMSKYSGNNNVVMGTQAMYYGSGNNNVAIGTNANYNGTNSETTYEGTTAVGHNAQARSLNSIAIGRESIAGTKDEIGNYFANAVAVGYKANATGLSSVAIGKEANSLKDYTISINGTASGYSSIALGTDSSTDGSYGVAIGNSAHTEKNYSVAIAFDSTATGYMSIAIGNGSTASAYSSIAIGSYAKANGRRNIAIGENALYNNQSGNSNTAIGENACLYVTGSNKTCIGSNSGPNSGTKYANRDDTVERIFIGRQSKFNGGPAVLEVHNDPGSVRNVRATGSGKGDQTYEIEKTGVVVNGNLFVKGMIFFNDGSDDWSYPGTIKYNGKNDGYGAQAYGRQITQNADLIYYSDYAGKVVHQRQDSDRRLKYVGKENTSGLDKIKQLKVFNYVYKKDTTKTPHVGVIAQDLQKVFPNAVKKGADGFLTIRMEDMFYAVINAIKELDAKYQAQEKRIDDLEKRIEKLEARK